MTSIPHNATPVDLINIPFADIKAIAIHVGDDANANAAAKLCCSPCLLGVSARRKEGDSMKPEDGQYIQPSIGWVSEQNKRKTKIQRPNQSYTDPNLTLSSTSW